MPSYLHHVALVYRHLLETWKHSNLLSFGSRKESERGTKPNSLIIPPPDAVPFSDEWLAAIEAAGEVTTLYVVYSVSSF